MLSNKIMTAMAGMLPAREDSDVFWNIVIYVSDIFSILYSCRQKQPVKGAFYVR